MKIRNIIRIVLIIFYLDVILFINLNEETATWDLIYWIKDYVFIIGCIYLIWKAFSDKLIRCLTVPIAFYYLFELICDIIKIVNIELHDRIYNTTIINYILGLSLLASLIVGFVVLNRKLIYIYIKKTKICNHANKGISGS